MSRVARIRLVLAVIGTAVTVIALAVAIFQVYLQVHQGERKADPVAVTSPAPRKQLALNEAFQLTPVYFGNQLTVAVRKMNTELGGYLRLYACGADRPLMQFVGETAYSKGPEEFTFTSEYSAPSVLLLLNLDPSGQEPVSVVAPWQLTRLSRLREPVQKSGSLNCIDVQGTQQ